MCCAEATTVGQFYGDTSYTLSPESTAISHTSGRPVIYYAAPASVPWSLVFDLVDIDVGYNIITIPVDWSVYRISDTDISWSVLGGSADGGLTVTGVTARGRWQPGQSEQTGSVVVTVLRESDQQPTSAVVSVHGVLSYDGGSDSVSLGYASWAHTGDCTVTNAPYVPDSQSIVTAINAQTAQQQTHYDDLTQSGTDDGAGDTGFTASSGAQVDAVKGKIGILDFADTVIHQLANVFVLSDQSTVLTFPAFSLPMGDGEEVKLWDEYTYDLAVLDEQVPAVMTAVRFAVTVLVWSCVLRYLTAVYHSIFGGEVR